MSDIDPRLLNAPLLRRISHALDGMRTGEQVWLLVQPEPPYKVHLITPDESLAVAEHQRYPDSILGGPFNTERDRDQQGEGIDPLFYHWCHNPDCTPCGDDNGNSFHRPSVYSVCEATDIAYTTRAEFPSHSPMTGENVLKRIELRWFWDQGGQEQSEFRVYSWDPGSEPQDRVMVDAIFFTRAAVEEFFLPRIAHVQGPEYAEAMRQRLG